MIRSIFGAAALTAALGSLTLGVVSGLPGGPAAELQENGGAAQAPAARGDVLPALDELIARHDCLACHDPEAALRGRLDPVLAPDLAGVTDRVATGWLLEFLQDPRGVRPGTVHPHQLAALPEKGRPLVAESIVQFLASKDRSRASTDDAAEPVLDVQTAGVGELERGRRLFHSVGCVACHGPQESAYDLEISLIELIAEREALEAEGVDPEEEDDGEVEEPVPVRPGVLAPDPHPLPTDLVRKVRVSDLAAFLVDPVAVRPSGHCPSMDLSPSDARAVAVYLLRGQAQRIDGSFERRPGLQLLTYVGQFGGAGGGLAALDRLQYADSKVVRAIDLAEKPRDNQFGMRFSGFLEVPADGAYTFHLTSDDGSMLRVGGEVLIDNGGTHPPRTRSGRIELIEGPIPIEVTFFEAGGGEQLSFEWEGPGLERSTPEATAFSHWSLTHRLLGADGQPAEPVSIAPKDDLVERGRLAFARLGCAACHGGMLDEPPPEEARTAPTLEQMSAARPGVLVCLRPDGRYAFDEETVGELLAAFVEPEAIAADAADPRRLVERRLTGRRCYSCHRRDDVGGVHPDVAPFYTGDEDAELGDQGRFPPTLTAVGRKFKPDVLRAALRGEESVRPYLTTRMPRMGERGVAGLAELLEVVDGAATAVVAPEGVTCDVSTVDAGRRLAGDRGGLGCVQCHGFLGTKSLGVQAVDLGEMGRRLRFDWFRDLLRNPSNVDLDARMANLWIDGESPVQDIADGEIDRQIEALWCWLGEGDAMAPPPGLDSGPWAYEIDASQRTRAIAVFMRDVSPRVLCVGTPASVHFAFDEQNARLAKAWRGRFLNAEGTWKGRAGALESPGSNDGVDLPAGLPIRPIADLYAPWPEAAGAEAGARSTGRTTNADGSMTFRYSIGALRVEETVSPTTLRVTMGAADDSAERLGIERRFVVRAPAGALDSPVVARVLVARQFDRLASGRWRVDGGEWPVVEVDEASAKTARLLKPARSDEEVFGADDEDRPALDPRQLEASRGEQGTEEPLTELRIPVLMVPDGEGSSALVGSFSWRYAW